MSAIGLLEPVVGRRRGSIPRLRPDERCARLCIVRVPGDHGGRWHGLVWDDELQWHEAAAVWSGARIRLLILEREPLRVDAALLGAAQLCAAHGEWSATLLRRIDGDLARRSLRANADRTTAGSETRPFARPFAPLALLIDAEGAFDFWFDDAGEFGGRPVRVCGTLGAGVQRATLYVR